MKKSNQKILLLILCLAAFLTAAYLLYKRYKLAKVDKTPTSYADALAVLDSGGKTKAPKKSGTKTASAAPKTGDPLDGLSLGVNVDKDRVLSKGMKTNEVKVLQAMLNKKLPYYEALTIDGAFGTNTEKALKKLTGKTQTTLSAAVMALHLRLP